MRLAVFPDRDTLGSWVARQAARILRDSIAQQGHARLVVATGSSQFEVLEHLVRAPEIDWSLIDGFHLDEYVGLRDSHPASFCRYLRERFVDQVALRSFHYLRGDTDPMEVIHHANDSISRAPIDLALIGIGENGHLAFNDPPADFDCEDPYHCVTLDEDCRKQQVGEGWFDGLDDVPEQAISMTIRQILSSRQILCTVPDQRKAEAVRNTLIGEIGPELPSTTLRQHDATIVAIDEAAASLLEESVRRRFEGSVDR